MGRAEVLSAFSGHEHQISTTMSSKLTLQVVDCICWPCIRVNTLTSNYVISVPHTPPTHEKMVWWTKSNFLRWCMCMLLQHAKVHCGGKRKSMILLKIQNWQNL